MVKVFLIIFEIHEADDIFKTKSIVRIKMKTIFSWDMFVRFMFCLFVSFDSLLLINNLSVKQGLNQY